MAEPSSWIAVVDDDPSVLRALARLLRSRGLETRTFESGRLFLGALAGGPPGCLIVDVRMPDMTGIELQERLRRLGAQIPTIVISAHVDAATRERCGALGAIAILVKPLQDEALFSAIGRAQAVARSGGA